MLLVLLPGLIACTIPYSAVMYIHNTCTYMYIHNLCKQLYPQIVATQKRTARMNSSCKQRNTVLDYPIFNKGTPTPQHAPTHTHTHTTMVDRAICLPWDKNFVLTSLGQTVVSEKFTEIYKGIQRYPSVSISPRTDIEKSSMGGRPIIHCYTYQCSQTSHPTACGDDIDTQESEHCPMCVVRCQGWRVLCLIFMSVKDGYVCTKAQGWSLGTSGEKTNRYAHVYL